MYRNGPSATTKCARGVTHHRPPDADGNVGVVRYVVGRNEGRLEVDVVAVLVVFLLGESNPRAERQLQLAWAGRVR